MLSTEEWQEYEDYLSELTEDELKIELQWLDTLGKAKKRGSTIASIQPDTLQ
jgi:hypothetical protein